METRLLYLGDCIINLAHVVRADFTEIYPGGEEKFDADSGQTFITRPRQASLALTLTAVELDTHIDDYASGYYLAAASSSQVVVVRGEVAENAWHYLIGQSVGLASTAEVAQ